MESGSTEKKKVLFICFGNMIRSQIAEGFAREHGGSFLQIFSAGLHPMRMVAEEAVLVMEEAGIDISGQHSKGLDEVPLQEMDYVVNMSGHSAGEFLPDSLAGTVIEWGINDPLGRSIRHFRSTRDEIKKRVEEFVKWVWKESATRRSE